MALDLKDLINIGFSKVKNKGRLNFNNIEEFEEELDREWFFSYFNNLNNINDVGFDEEIDKVKKEIEYKSDDGYFDKYKKLYYYSINIIKDHKYINEKDIKNLVEKKNKYNTIYNSLVNPDYSLLFKDENEPFYFKNFFDFYKTYHNNDSTSFYEYLKNDDNFDIYFTYLDLFNVNFETIKFFLLKLNFKSIERIIYINENLNKEKLEKNPFRNLMIKNRVIKYYNTFKFKLYESVESWLSKQKIDKNFNKQPKLKKFLEMIVEFINIKNILIYFKKNDYDDDKDDVELNIDDDELNIDDDDNNNNKNLNIEEYKIMLNLFNPGKFKIIDNKIKVSSNNQIEIYKETIKKINDYINCEFENENIQKIEKNLKDFSRYFLPELLNSKNNLDINLLMYFLNNPKNNENIILGLLNKYKSIL